MLDYTIGGSAIARGITPNLVFAFELYVFGFSQEVNHLAPFLSFFKTILSSNSQTQDALVVKTFFFGI